MSNSEQSLLCWDQSQDGRRGAQTCLLICAAAALDFGDEEEDGVAANARMFATIVDAGLPPPRSHKAKPNSGESAHEVPCNA